MQDMACYVVIKEGKELDGGLPSQLGNMLGLNKMADILQTCFQMHFLIVNCLHSE